MAQMHTDAGRSGTLVSVNLRATYTSHCGKIFIRAHCAQDKTWMLGT